MRSSLVDDLFFFIDDTVIVLKKDGLNNELVIMENIEIKIDNIKVCDIITYLNI